MSPSETDQAQSQLITGEVRIGFSQQLHSSADRGFAAADGSRERVKDHAHLWRQPVEIHLATGYLSAAGSVSRERKSHFLGGDLNTYLRPCSDKL